MVECLNPWRQTSFSLCTKLWAHSWTMQFVGQDPRQEVIINRAGSGYFFWPGSGLGLALFALRPDWGANVDQIWPIFYQFFSQKCNFFWLSQAGLGNPKSGCNRIRPLKTNGLWAKFWVGLRPDSALIIKIWLIHTTKGISSFICHSKFKCILASRKLHKIRIVL